MIKRFLTYVSVFVVLLAPAAISSFAQSPNTASMVVVVEDQNGATVRDAKVSVVNEATGASREMTTGGEGTVTVPALSLTGAYAVSVSKDGFSTEQRKDITLRSGETATIRVTLAVGASKAEVTVVGTAEGVHASPQIGLPLGTKQINETPILGRKVT